MGQPGRGGVWEECVITSPPHTQIVGLSATLPNALQLAEWMESVTGRPTKLVDAPGARPVPLKYLFATREGLFPLFRNENAGPGSPLGLLGYRGDGISPKKAADKKMKKRAKGFGQSNDDDDDDIDEKLPKGLQINPALSSLAQRRMQKVNRMIERQNEQQRARRESRWDDEWDTSDGGRSGGRGRGRGRDRDTDRWETDRRRMTTREERKERERITRREMRKAVPSLPILLTRLNEKKLLPAIFFIFSRAGCDQAAETISASFKGPRDPTVNIDFDEEADRQRRRSRKEQRWSPDKTVVEDVDGRSFRVKGNFVDDSILQSVFDARRSDIDYTSDVSGSPLSKDNAKFYSSAGLLSFDEVRQVANRVSQFNIENEEIALPDETIEQLLFGIGRHHAGMLPAHKMLVETLFRSNLMRAVFATETLAAGINMPARTTVVCALAKRGGGGSMDLLETSNLLQMAGRAGRRGYVQRHVC
jgi:superfamily II RNA helicase